MADSAERTSSVRAGLLLADLRRDYRLLQFDRENCQTNPLDQFTEWFEQAQRADLPEPNAFSLATVAKDGRPSCRIVLLKELDESGFVFYTSYTSRKGRELAANPACALTFLWIELERQVRVEGIAERVSREKTEEYFQKRPRGSRLGALASSQSQTVADRGVLDRRLQELEEEYRNTERIPVPDYWGGYLVIPDRLEFWQGRPNRLHDRLVYIKEGSGNWRIDRLSP